MIRNKYTPRDGSEPGLSGVLKAQLRLENHVHVGSGSTELGVEGKQFEHKPSFDDLVRAVAVEGIVRAEYMDTVRYADKPCMPGSTLKGLMRARLELLTIAHDGEVESCFRQASRWLPKPPHGVRHAKIWGNSVLEDRGPGCDATRSYMVCKVCDIFGAPGLASRVYPGNFCGGSLVRLELDHGERIVALEPGGVLDGEISFSHLKPWELGAVLVAMGADREGDFVKILVGKNKYRARRLVSGDRIRFGVAFFRLLEARLSGPEDIVEGAVGIKEAEAVVRGPDLNPLVSRLVGMAASGIRGLSGGVGFSEADAVGRLA